MPILAVTMTDWYIGGWNVISEEAYERYKSWMPVCMVLGLAPHASFLLKTVSTQRLPTTVPWLKQEVFDSKFIDGENRCE